jgi:signal recognition particle GTPase
VRAAGTLHHRPGDSRQRRLVHALSGGLDLEDLASQLQQMRKMGGMSGLLGMLPGLGKTQSGS